MNLKTGLVTKHLIMSLSLVLSSLMLQAQDPSNGKALFEQHCTSCHAIDQKLIGPALKNAHTKYDEAWLISWIKNSADMIAKGDPKAVKIYEEYNKLAMNSFDYLSNNEIKDIIAYIGEASTAAPVAAADAGVAGTQQPANVTEAASSGSSSGNYSNWLIALIVLALLVILVQIFNTLQLISDYTKVKVFNPQYTNAVLMLVFFVVGMAAAIWEFKIHGPYADLPAASEHAKSVDAMFNATLIITGIVFVITQFLLFWYSYAYRGKEGRKALFYSHNNRLEFIWTIIPAIALTVLVLNGFKMWSNITSKAPEEAHQIEVFGYQFGWKARYPGKDGKLGEVNFNLISGSNELGLGVKPEYEKLYKEVSEKVKTLQEEHDFYARNLKPTPKEYELISENKKKLKLAKGHLSRLETLGKSQSLFSVAAMDDFIPGEIHIPVNEPVQLKFRARDVIHSAYLPYFRVQMNCVPGMPTSFWFKPTKTTAEIRAEKNDPNFDYHLVCAKICGAAHFNMKIKVVVESKAEYNKWLASQKPRFGSGVTEMRADNSAETEIENKEIVSIK